MSKIRVLIPLFVLILAGLACGGNPTSPAATAPQGGMGLPFTATPPAAGAKPTAAVVTALPSAPSLPVETPTPFAFTPQWTPQSQAEAQKVIQDYAREVLGLEIAITSGVGRVKDIEIPVAYEEGVSYALSLSGVSYFGVWPDGMASVSLGSGTATGEFITDIQEGSLGVFSVRVNQPPPADGATALALIQATYPGLAALEFFPSEPSEQGYIYNYTKADNYSIRDGAVNLKGVIITAGTTAGRRPGVTLVWVIVASGALTTPFE